ncbi:hypothetical protein EV127DRAFT_214547 [Xylaria flabelliformis]|nr:hypothetical protein EV127DRAFT_214547 [Xylaria flabelliformis]
MLHWALLSRHLVSPLLPWAIRFTLTNFRSPGQLLLFVQFSNPVSRRACHIRKNSLSGPFVMLTVIIQQPSGARASPNQSAHASSLIRFGRSAVLLSCTASNNCPQAGQIRQTELATGLVEILPTLSETNEICPPQDVRSFAILASTSNVRLGPSS